MENCNISGKIREKSGNFEVDDKWRHCTVEKILNTCIETEKSKQTSKHCLHKLLCLSFKCFLLCVW